MEHDEETIRELTEFATTTARTLQNHREQLQRHEEILHAQYKGGTSHRDAIEVLRKDMLSLGELVNAQSVLLQSIQRTLLKIVTTLGLPPEMFANGIRQPRDSRSCPICRPHTRLNYTFSTKHVPCLPYTRQKPL